MICHYRRVSTQLSPPNHPSYPPVNLPPAPNPTLSSKNSPHIPQRAPVSLRTVAPSAPPPPHTLPWDNLPLHTDGIMCVCAFAPMCLQYSFNVKTCLFKGRQGKSQPHSHKSRAIFNYFSENFSNGVFEAQCRPDFSIFIHLHLIWFH